MDKVAQLTTTDVSELAKRLALFYGFYYDLIEAKQIYLNLDTIPNDTVDVIQVDKAEWGRWQKIKSIINNFEIPQ